jgi:iron complex transport system ATP-binding protein
MMRATGLAVLRRGQKVLHGIDLALAGGEFVVLAGPNGAGKSTLLRALAGLQAHTGHVTAPKPRAEKIGYLAQGAASAWDLTLRQVAGLGRLPHHGADPDGAVDRALADCGLCALADRPISSVSGGEARRAMLARVLATEPEVLLLDEPLADLDPAHAFAMLALLRRQADAGRAVMAVLHAPELAAQAATRLVVLRQGRLVADGPPAATLAAAARAYGVGFGAVQGFLPASGWPA